MTFSLLIYISPYQVEYREGEEEEEGENEDVEEEEPKDDEEEEGKEDLDDMIPKPDWKPPPGNVSIIFSN